jgi:rhamnosyltransferase
MTARTKQPGCLAAQTSATDNTAQRNRSAARAVPGSPEVLVSPPQATAGARFRVLILLASRNGARWIRQQLASILAQEDVEVRVAIRDDASRDTTLLEIAAFTPDDRVRLAPVSAPTGSAAQNFLALILENPADEFEYVAFSDQDDIWHPDKLARACRMLSAERSAGYSSATIAVWPDGSTAALEQANAATSADFLFEGAGQGCTFVLRAEFYSRVRAFVREHHPLTRVVRYHDWMVYALARAWGESWIFDSRPSTSYRQHGENDTGARTTLAAARKRLALIRNGWYRNQLEAIAAICAAAAPASPVVARWTSLLATKGTWRRRLQIASFCLRGGRRKRLDNIVLICSAVAGWI